MRKENWKKIISGILCIALLVEGVPYSLNRASAQDENSETVPLTEDETKTEVKSERTENSTTYDLGNGIRQTEYYMQDVRYHDNETDKLVDYNSSLKIMKEDEIQEESLSGYLYENKKGDDKNYLPEILSEDTPVLSESEDCHLEISPIQNSSEILESETNQEVVEDIYGDTKKEITSVIYAGDDSDIQYDYQSTQNGIKETIILKEKPQNNEFRFQMVLKNAFAVIEGEEELTEEEIERGRTSESQIAETGYGINIYNRKSEMKGYIPAGNLNDATGDKYSEDCYYRINRTAFEEKGKDQFTTYEVTLCVDKQYFETENLTYPVSIDPTCYWVSGNGTNSSCTINEAYVQSGTKKENNYSTNVETMVVGRFNGNVCRSFLHINNLKAMMKGKYIIDSKLQVIETNDCEKGVIIYAKRITSSWNHTKVTYANQPTFYPTVYGSITTSGVKGKVDSIDVSGFTRGLLSGSFENHGICLVSARESDTSFQKFGRFYNSNTANGKPKLVVTYCDAPTVPTNINFSPMYIKPGGSTVATWSGMTSPYLKNYEYRINNYDEVNKKETTNAVSYTTLNKNGSGQYVIPLKNSSGVNLPERCYKIVLHGKDSQGNVGAGDGRLVYVDGTAPVIGSVSTNNSDLTSYGKKLPSVTWNNVTDNRKLNSFKLSVNGTLHNIYNLSSSGSFTCTSTAGVAQGKNILKFIATDQAGNVTESKEMVYYYDGIVPVVRALETIPTTSETSASTEVPKINCGVTDNVGLASVQYSLDGVNYRALSGSCGTFALPESLFTTSGIYTIYLKGIDKAGNVSQIQKVNYYYRDSSGEYLPQNVVIRELPDGQTELFWDKCYKENLPKNMSYSVYRSTAKEFIPSADTLVKAGVKDHKAILPSAGFNKTYYYKICVVKSAEGKELTRSGYTDAVSSTTVKKEELSKCLGSLDYTARESISLPDGNASVEEDNGNLLYIHNGITMPAVHLSINVTPTYNSGSCLQGLLGTGWRLPFECRILTAENGYRYIDETGAKHTFTENSEGEYTTSTDTEYVLTVEDGNYTKDEVDYPYAYVLKTGTATDYFSSNGKLVATEESNGSYLIYSYEENYDLLTAITTKTGKKTQFHYDTDLLKKGKVRLISVTFSGEENSSYRENLAFYYTGDFLSKITHTGTDGVSTLSTQFTYSDEILSQVISPSGRKYILEHSGDKITKITDPLENVISFTYGSGKTTVETINDTGNLISQTSGEYDDKGRLIAETDNQGNMITYRYGTGLNEYQITETTSKVNYETIGEDGKVERRSTEKITSTQYNTDGTVDSEKDESGNTTEYTYEGSDYPDQPSQIVETNCDGETISEETISYDDNGNVITDTLKSGKEITVTTNEYDEMGEQTGSVSTVQGEVSSTEESEFDEEGNETKEISTAGTVSDEQTVTYDDMGRTLTETSKTEGTATAYQYDAFGRTIKTIVTYLASGKKETETKSYDVESNIVQETSKDGVITKYTYDEADRVLTETIIKGETRTRTYQYDYETITIYGGGQIQRTIVDASKKVVKNQNGTVTEIQYSDGNGQVVRSFVNGIYTDTFYDESGHATVINVLGTDVRQSDSNLTLQVYDEDGNVTDTIRNPEIKENEYYTGADSIWTKVSYDTDGNVISETDAEGHQTKYSYNTNKQLVEVTKADGTKGNRYTYQETDEEKHTLTDTTTGARGRKTKNVFNASGQLLSLEDYGEEGEQILTSYEYDSTGNKIKETYGTGAYLVYSYTEQNQIESVSSYKKNGSKQTETDYIYDKNGNITRMTDYTILDEKKVPLRTLVIEYDAFQRVTSYAEIDGTDAPTEEEILASAVRYGYDSLDRLIEISYAEKEGVTGLQYCYNDVDWLTAVYAKVQGQQEKIRLRQYTYDRHGKVKAIEDSLNFLQGGTDTIRKEYTYDTFDRVQQMQCVDVQSDTVKQRYEYSYDKNGNILSKQEWNAYPETEIDKITKYGYNELGQLISSEETNAVTDVTIQNQYRYDTAGNRILMKKDGKTTTYTYNGLDQLMRADEEDSCRTYTYDSAGNQSSVTDADGTVTKYQYDPKNQLTKVTESTGDSTKIIQENSYNGNGQRISKKENGKESIYYYQNSSLLKTTDVGGDLQALYLYGNTGNMIAVEDGTGQNLTSYTYAKDVQGSIIELIEETGKSNTHYSYDDYGCTEVTGSQTVANELAYTGGVYDRTTGEYYLNARYYDPEDARFLTQDTYRGENKQPNTWNLYTYCGENPVNYVDPSGHFALALSLPALNFAAAVAAAGAAVLPAVAVACAVVAVGHLAWTAYQHTRVVKNVKKETLVLTDVKEKRQKGKPYQLAYIGKSSKLIKFGKKLHFCEALTILGVSKGVQAAAKNLKKRVSLTKKQFRGSKAWKLISKHQENIGLVGIFADSKVAAKTLALATGSHKDPEVHKSGYYGHYHDKKHVIHIWYGEPIYYKI